MKSLHQTASKEHFNFLIGEKIIKLSDVITTTIIYVPQPPYSCFDEHSMVFSSEQKAKDWIKKYVTETFSEAYSKKEIQSYTNEDIERAMKNWIISRFSLDSLLPTNKVYFCISEPYSQPIYIGNNEEIYNAISEQEIKFVKTVDNDKFLL